MYKKLQEVAKQKCKQLFVESFSFDLNNIDRIVLPNENSKLIESIDNKKYEAIAIVEGTPVTRFSPNANNRLYPKKLWEKVKKEDAFEGKLCFANHLEEIDITSTVGVWHNFRIDEKNEIGKADLYLIGEKGKLFLDTLKAGGSCDLSTTGYGIYESRQEELQNYKDISEEIEIVEYDSFDLQSCDWVFNASQNVRATINNVVSEDVKIKQENNNISVSENTNPQNNNNNINNIDNIKDNNNNLNLDTTPLFEKRVTNNNDNIKEKNKMVEKLELANYKDSKKKAIKEAIKNPNKKEGLDELLQIKEDIKEVLDVTEGKSLIEHVDKSINSLIENLNRTIMEQASTIETLKQKDEMAEDMLEDLRKKYNKSIAVFKEIKKSVSIKEEEDENTEIEGSKEESNDVTKGEADNGTMTEEVDEVGAEVIPVEDVVDEDEIVVKEAIKAVKASLKKKQEELKKAKSKVKEEAEVEDEKKDDDKEVEVKEEAETDEKEKEDETEEDMKESIKKMKERILQLEQELVNNDKEDETEDKNEVEIREEEGDMEDENMEDEDMISESVLCKKFGIKSLSEAKLIEEDDVEMEDEEEDEEIEMEEEMDNDMEDEEEMEMEESLKQKPKFRESNITKIKESTRKNWISDTGWK